jgi:hypothetical protein
MKLFSFSVRWVFYQASQEVGGLFEKCAAACRGINNAFCIIHYVLGCVIHTFSFSLFSHTGLYNNRGVG